MPRPGPKAAPASPVERAATRNQRAEKASEQLRSDLITRAAKHNIKKQTSPASADPGSRRSNRPGANQPDAHKHCRAENFVFDSDLCGRYDLIRL